MINYTNNIFICDLANRYAPVIQGIIDSNSKFFRINQPIEWHFFFDDRVAIFGACNPQTNVISVNVASVDFSFQRDEPLHIESFLVHEIRHLYQNLEKAAYKDNPAKCHDAELAKKWLDEEGHYIPPLNDENKQNAGYSTQAIELDAFSFSFAVMKYKYGNVPYLSIPKAYEPSEFQKLVDKWIEVFQEEGL